MAAALLAMTATPAFASGLQLAWNHCFGQAGAQSMRTSTCNVNTGSQTMIASFMPPAGITKLEGIEVYIDFHVLGGVMPCWWNFTAGHLRSAQLTPLPVSPTDVNGNPLVLCDNHYFLDRGATGGGWMTLIGVDVGRLQGVVTIPAGTGEPVQADAQEFGVGFRISNVGTVPAVSCQGCAALACFILKLIRLYRPGLPDVALDAPHPGSNNWITWQGDDATTNCPGSHGIYPPIPVLHRTWGSIKSVYR